MNRKLVTILILIFAFARLVSFYFQPGTSVNTIFALAFVLGTSYFLAKKSILGWFMIAGEIILGGGGSYFGAFGISLRTLLLGVAILFFFLYSRQEIFLNERRSLIVIILFLTGVYGAVHGLILHNQNGLLIQDLIPYFFLFYFFPLSKLLRNDKFVSFCRSALVAAVIGGALFIIFTFIGYAEHFFILQDPYYHWFRDIAGGKITLVQFDFYRLVLNEHLLLIPLLLHYLYRSIRHNEKAPFYLSLLLLFILGINLTRIYMVGLIVGCILIIAKERTKRSVIVSAFTALLFFVMFSGLYLYASHGQSFGLEVFGLRLQSIVMPNTENSSLSRMLILPKAFEMIQTRPFLGNGLGSIVTVFSPIFKTEITTNHFDWGYLEILAELGLIGFVLWIAFLRGVFRNIKKLPEWQLPVFFSFLTINITSPALFHVLGVVLLITLLAMPSDVSEAPASELPHSQ